MSRPVPKTETLRKRYAIYSTTEQDGEINWYISPPMDELTDLDFDFIQRAIEEANKFAQGEKSLDSKGALAYAEVLPWLDKEYEPTIDLSYSESLFLFSDKISTRDGYKKLTKGWTMFSGMNNKLLAEYSNNYQLIIAEINSWV